MGDECHAMETTPGNKLPRRTMPQASDEHCDKVIYVRTHLTLAVTTERNIEVVTQPR